MRYDTRLLAKTALIFFGLLFLVCVWLGRRERITKTPEGDKITCRDVGILMDVLDVPFPDDMASDGEAYLTYSRYIELCKRLDVDGMQLPDYADRYEPDSPVLKEDWYNAFRIMLAYLDTESSVWETEVFVLKTDGEQREAYTQNAALFTVYHYLSPEFEESELHSLTAYVQGENLLTVVEVIPREHELKNVWVTESASGGLECFYHRTAFYAPTDQSVERECVADLIFRDGRIVKARAKDKKVHGKLLWISDEEIEIEGCGVYPIAKDMEIYRLYGSLETLRRNDLKIGYADTDYVVDSGEVCACLVSEKEEADRIRVLLKNTAENSNYYDAVELTVDGETVRIEADDMETGERRSYHCAALTDKIIVDAVGITKADNAYRGTIECYRTEDGIVLINELPLEEYLYAVVPSEMPASYPSEALKAQAICARTYAYLYILHAGLPEMGAHVDDTTSYQVYHNIAENAATTTAVKETDGMLLTYEGTPARNYYYSTSCGVGTDAGIWKAGGAEDIVYMQAERLNTDIRGIDVSGDGSKEAEETDALREEDYFRAFITSVDENDLECTEPWYRWTYTVESIDVEGMLGRLRSRYAASPESVLTQAEGGYYVSQPIDRLGSIQDISIVQRGPGGVADELLIKADTGIYKVVAEYNIRYVLCDRASEVRKQDGSAAIPTSILPSGFFVIDTGNHQENVVGYTLIGGGYGHGVGMSQNGAKALGQEGADCEQILAYFFAGCELKEITAATDL